MKPAPWTMASFVPSITMLPIVVAPAVIDRLPLPPTIRWSVVSAWNSTFWLATRLTLTLWRSWFWRKNSPIWLPAILPVPPEMIVMLVGSISRLPPEPASIFPPRPTCLPLTSIKPPLPVDVDVVGRRHQHRAAGAVRRKGVRVDNAVQIDDRVHHFRGNAGRDDHLARARLQRSAVVHPHGLAGAHDLLHRARRHDEIDQARAAQIQREAVGPGQRDGAQIGLDEARVLHIGGRQNGKPAVGDRNLVMVDHRAIAAAAVAGSLGRIAVHRHSRRRQQGADVHMGGAGKGDPGTVQGEEPDVGVEGTGQ